MYGALFVLLERERAWDSLCADEASALPNVFEASPETRR
jgi:hypothetical protein